MIAFTDAANEKSKENQAKFDTLFLALQAIQQIGTEAKLNAAIRSEADFLSRRVMAGEPVPGAHWAEWQSRRTTFESALSQWISLASGWHSKADQVVSRVDLTGDVPDELDSLFEGSKAVIAYRTFAQKFANWNSFEHIIRTKLHIAAFGGPDAQEILRLPQ